MSAVASAEKDAAASSSTQHTVASEVLISFRTELDSFRISEAPIMMPTRLKRLGLSEVVNHMRGSRDVVPFEFSHDGSLLRGSVAELLRQKQLSSEEVLILYYQPATEPPESSETYEQPDWVSSLDCGRSGTCLAGCYDGHARFLNVETGAVVCSTDQAHDGPVHAVALANVGSNTLVVTGAGDNSVRIWTADFQQVNHRSASSMTCSFVGRTHTGGVCSVAINPGRELFCSGSWDKSVCLWNLKATSDPDADTSDDRTAKRRRTGESGAASDVETAKELEPKAQLNGHTGAVTGCAWASVTSLFTGSWDHKIVSWDMEAGQEVQTFYGSKVVTGLDYNPARGLLASSHADHAIRLWDPRTDSADVKPTLLRSHGAWAADVKWSFGSDYHFCSAAHDGTVKMWDLRSSIPLHTAEDAHEGKVLCVDWSQANQIVSGGDDCKVNVLHFDARS